MPGSQDASHNPFTRTHTQGVHYSSLCLNKQNKLLFLLCSYNKFTFFVAPINIAKIFQIFTFVNPKKCVK